MLFYMLTEKLRQQKMLFPNNVVLNVKTFDRFKNECFLKLQTREKNKIVNFQRQEKSKTKKENSTKNIIIIDFSEII